MRRRKPYFHLIWIVTFIVVLFTIRNKPKKVTVKDGKSQIKRIFLATTLFRKKSWEFMLHKRLFNLSQPYRCLSMNPCQLTNDSAKADALLFHGGDLGSVHPVTYSTRTARQRWVFLSWESISNVHLNDSWRYNFNWTATYMRNSDIVTPYFRGYVRLSDAEMASVSSRQLYNSSEKTGFAFAVMSNCKAQKRLQYFEALRRHMNVDIFGKCGHPLGSGFDVITNISRRYRFYLAFENSLCRDYITEKFWINGEQNFAVPVVRGGLSRKDYVKVAPPNSFVYAGDFDNAEKLAHFLKSLSQNEVEYARYFDWRRKFKIDNYDKPEIMMCRLCNRLHTDRTHSIADIQSFWNREKYCRE